jgi:DNA-binding NarL/FixJ family response regulator
MSESVVSGAVTEHRGSPNGQQAAPARVPVAVFAEDEILRAGVFHQLRQRPEVELVPPEEVGRSRAALVVVDRVDEDTVRLLRTLQHGSSCRTCLVVGRFEPNALQTVVDCGVAAVIRRTDTNSDRLVRTILDVAKGDGVLPGDLVSRLLDHVGRLQRAVLDPRRPGLATLSGREVDMLRLVAEGFDTVEIAQKTSYSERTVKNVLHEVTTRLNLRNRAHAVGYAMRNGLI